MVPEEGHRKVLEAFSSAALLLGERTRFQKLVWGLWKRLRDKKLEVRQKTTVMSLINALFKAGNAEVSTRYIKDTAVI